MSSGQYNLIPGHRDIITIPAPLEVLHTFLGSYQRNTLAWGME